MRGERGDVAPRTAEGAPAIGAAHGVAAAVALSAAISLAMQLSLGLWVFKETGSYALAAVLLGCQWLLPVLWPTGIHRLGRGRDAGALAAVAQWMSGALTLALFGAVGLDSVPLVLALVVVCGFNDALTRSALGHAAQDRRAVDGYDAAARIERWRLVGGSTAGLLYAAAGGQLPITVFACVATLAFAMTGASYLGFGRGHQLPSTKAPVPSRTAIRGSLAQQPTARRWLWQLSLVAAFQGVHSTVLLSYPVQRLELDSPGIGLLSTLSLIGVVTGARLAGRSAVRVLLARVPSWLLVAAVTVAATGAVSITQPLPGFVVFLCFPVLFELTFVRFNSLFVAATISEHSDTLFALRAILLPLATVLGLLLSASLLIYAPVHISTAVTTGALTLGAVLVAVRHGPTEATGHVS